MPAKREGWVQVPLYLLEETAADLEEFASATGETKSSVVRRAVVELLARELTELRERGRRSSKGRSAS